MQSVKEITRINLQSRDFFLSNEREIYLVIPGATVDNCYISNATTPTIPLKSSLPLDFTHDPLYTDYQKDVIRYKPLMISEYEK
jgi:hypothetical protein